MVNKEKSRLYHGIPQFCEGNKEGLKTMTLEDSVRRSRGYKSGVVETAQTTFVMGGN